MNSSTPKTNGPLPPTSRDEGVGRVAEWLIAGMRPSQVPGQAAKEGWPLTSEQVLDIIGDAYALIAGDAEIDPEREQAKAVARLNLLYTRSLAIQDYKTALSAQIELGKAVARAANPFAEPTKPEPKKPNGNARKKT